MDAPTPYAPNELLRDRFPALQQTAYLDAAAVGIPSDGVREAANAVLFDHQQLGGAAGQARQAMSAEVRRQVATLIGGDPARVAFTQNTSTGLSLVINGLDWHDGDNVVVPSGEFPSNFYPWTRLRDWGVTLREIPMIDGHADLDALHAAVDTRTRVLAISAVHYASGWRYHLASLADTCHRFGALLVVDGTQSVGALTLDVQQQGIDVLAVSAHKWMLGPLGIGFVHLSKHAFKTLRPSTVGWRSVNDPYAFTHEPRLADDGRRFESGTENSAGIAGLGAAVSTVLDIGPAVVEHQILCAADALTHHLDATAGQSCDRLPRHTAQESCLPPPAATTAQHTRVSSQQESDAPSAAPLSASPPHYYTSRSDIEQIPGSHKP